MVKRIPPIVLKGYLCIFVAFATFFLVRLHIVTNIFKDNDTLENRGLSDYKTYMTKKEYSDTQSLLTITNTMLSKIKCTYWLSSHALLGTFMYFDVLPWQQEIEILVDHRCKLDIKYIFKLRKDISIYSDEFYIKISYKDGQKIQYNSTHNVPWTFPYINLKFYYDDSYSIIERDEMHRTYEYDRKEILPTCYHPFMDVVMPVPKYSDSYLTMKFNGKCISSDIDGRTGKKLSDTHLMNKESSDYVVRDGVRSVQCIKLEPFFPSIQRSLLSGNMIMEELGEKVFVNKNDCIIPEDSIKKKVETNKDFKSLMDLANKLDI